jgi:hypothetical protein
MFDASDTEVRDATARAAAAERTSKDVASRQAEDNKSRFLTELSRRVPDWGEIDALEEWNQFLAQRDPIARRVRNDLMVEAVKEGDVDAVEAIFNAFKTQAGYPTGAAPAPTPVPAPAPAPAPSARTRLERQAVPPITGATTSHTEGKVWTPNEIAKAYADAAMGKTPPEVFAPIEADILAARSEGRIRK